MMKGLFGPPLRLVCVLEERADLIGEQIRIELCYVDAIPRESNGKFRAVKSRVGRLRR